MIRAIVFDVGNTLVYFPARLSSSMTLRLIDKPLGLSQKSRLEEMRWIRFELNKKGNDHRHFAEAYLKAHGIRRSTRKVSRIEAILKKRGKAKAYAETRFVLRKLCKRYRLVAVSNMDASTAEIMKKLPFMKLFNEVIFSCDVRVVKPEKQIYELARKKTGVRPSECLWVGDLLDADYYGPKKCGFQAVLLNRKRKIMPKGVKQVNSLKQRVGLLNKQEE